MSADRSRKAKRADRSRGGASRPDTARDPAPESTRLEESDAELEAEVDAAAEELRESGVAHRIASGERAVAQAAPSADGGAAVASGSAAAGAATRAPVRTAAGRTIAPGGTAGQLPYVDDRLSKVWVALVALVFAGVLGYAFLGGKGGYLTRTPSPSPTPSASASPGPT
jgi:hypothetical protein